MITYSTSFVSFLKNSESKIARFLYNAHLNHADQPAYLLAITNKEIDYITFRLDGTISYLPAGKKHKENDNGDWARDGRQNGKAAKVIRKLFTAKALRLFKNSDFECFSNVYKAEYNDSGYILELQDNKSIPDVYDMERCEGQGSLQSSCMNSDIEYLNIYKYCDKLQILSLTNKEGLLAGRSLVWEINEEITLMDRIYVTSDWQYELFLNYARKNNFWHKEYYKSYYNKQDFITPLGQQQTKTFNIYTDTNFDYFPYIDTFSYGNHGVLSNSSSDTEYEYDQTNGSRTGDEENHDHEVWDEIDEFYIDEDDAIVIERGEHRGENTHQNNTVEVNGNTYWNQSADIILVDEILHHRDDCVYSEYEGTHILADESIEIDGEYYREDCDEIVEVDGTWYLKDSDEYVLITNTNAENEHEKIN